MYEPWPCNTLGSDRNPTLVFLHGFLGEGADWQTIAAALSSDYFCLLPDLPGHGANLPHLPTNPLSFRSLAKNLAHLLQRQAAPPVHLIGYSMGGRLALYFTLHHPDLVRSLTLESASPGIAQVEERRSRRVQDDQLAREILQNGLEAFLERWYALPLFASLNSKPQLLQLLKARRIRANPQWCARVIADLSPGRQPSVWRKLSQIHQPALLLAGELDEKYTAISRQVARRIPHARLEIAPGAGHNIHLETPQWVTLRIQDFIQKVEADTSDKQGNRQL